MLNWTSRTLCTHVIQIIRLTTSTCTSNKRETERLITREKTINLIDMKLVSFVYYVDECLYFELLNSDFCPQNWPHSLRHILTFSSSHQIKPLKFRTHSLGVNNVCTIVMTSTQSTWMNLAEWNAVKNLKNVPHFQKGTIRVVYSKEFNRVKNQKRRWNTSVQQ